MDRSRPWGTSSLRKVFTDRTLRLNGPSAWFSVGRSTWPSECRARRMQGDPAIQRIPIWHGCPLGESRSTPIVTCRGLLVPSDLGGERAVTSSAAAILEGRERPRVVGDFDREAAAKSTRVSSEPSLRRMLILIVL